MGSNFIDISNLEKKILRKGASLECDWKIIKKGMWSEAGELLYESIMMEERPHFLKVLVLMGSSDPMSMNNHLIQSSSSSCWSKSLHIGHALLASSKVD